MTINLYSTSSDPKTVNKSLTGISTITAQLVHPCNVLRPTIIVSGDGIVNALNANYLYMSRFARYYFIKSHTADTAVRLTLECEVDPLMSYNTSLLNTNQLITRSESIGKSTYIPDSKLPLANYKDMYVIAFEGGSMNLDSATNASYNFVLNVAGGVGQ